MQFNDLRDFATKGALHKYEDEDDEQMKVLSFVSNYQNIDEKLQLRLNAR
jgi:hypothetical protein